MNPKSPWSLFPVAEAAKAKTSVSVLLIAGLTYGGFWLGANQQAEKISSLKAEVQELRKSVDGCARQSRMDELLLNLTREELAVSGRVMQINQDTQVILSKLK